MRESVTRSVSELCILLLHNSVLQQCATVVRQNMGCLYRLGEAVGLLDMIRAFAHKITISEHYGARGVVCYREAHTA